MITKKTKNKSIEKEKDLKFHTTVTLLKHIKMNLILHNMNIHQSNLFLNKNQNLNILKPKLKLFKKLIIKLKILRLASFLIKITRSK